MTPSFLVDTIIYNNFYQYFSSLFYSNWLYYETGYLLIYWYYLYPFNVSSNSRC